MPPTKIRLGKQTAGKTLIVGGNDVTFGDVGAGQVVIETDGAVTTSPTVLIKAVDSGDIVATIQGSAEILGLLDLSGGSLRIPQGTTLPSIGLVEGLLFWKSDTDELFFYNGASWQIFSSAAVANFLLSGNEFSTNSTGFVEIMSFYANLKELFPVNDFKLQANIWVTGTATAELRLYNITDFVPVVNATITFAGTVPTIVESTSSSTPVDGLRQYTLDIRKVGGLPPHAVFVRGASLRQV